MCGFSYIRSCTVAGRNLWFTSGMTKITTKLQQAFLGPLVSRTDCRWCQGRLMEWLQTLDKLPSLILLVFDLEADVGSFCIMKGYRLWANVFSIEARSIRASHFTSVLKWLFRECYKWEGQGSPFLRADRASLKSFTIYPSLSCNRI